MRSVMWTCRDGDAVCTSESRLWFGQKIKFEKPRAEKHGPWVRSRFIASLLATANLLPDLITAVSLDRLIVTRARRLNAR